MCNEVADKKANDQNKQENTKKKKYKSKSYKAGLVKDVNCIHQSFSCVAQIFPYYMYM